MAAGDGLISMTPTSIAYSGTSASINADGGVDFTAVTSLSLNGVFTGDYDNYVLYFSGTTASGTNELWSRLRVSGVDATGTDYTSQRLFVYGTTVNGQRLTSQDNARLSAVRDNLLSAVSFMLYGPALAQPTAMRSVSVDAFQDASVLDRANTHSLSTAYDGITIYPGGSNMTGTVHVFGYEE